MKRNMRTGQGRGKYKERGERHGHGGQWAWQQSSRLRVHPRLPGPHLLRICASREDTTLPRESDLYSGICYTTAARSSGQPCYTLVHGPLSGPGWPWDWIDRREKPQTHNQEQEGARRHQEARENRLHPDLGVILKIFLFFYFTHPPTQFPLGNQQFLYI